jgi:two-component system LytT family response regulator
MMLKCIAVDDEPLALALLADNISKVPYLQLMAQCGDAFEATEVLQSQKIDLIFIDVQMPGITGLEFIESMVQKPMVILVTAYKQYALDGYKLNVVDYLMKPVALNRFMAACNKALELYRLKNASQLPLQTPPNYFFVNIDYGLLKIMVDDIIYIEGLRDYIKIHLKSTNAPVVVRMGVKAVEEQLPMHLFVRIHKSYIVAIESITSVRKNSVFIKNFELPIGETYRGAIESLIKKQ